MWKHWILTIHWVKRSDFITYKLTVWTVNQDLKTKSDLCGMWKPFIPSIKPTLEHDISQIVYIMHLSVSVH